MNCVLLAIKKCAKCVFGGWSRREEENINTFYTKSKSKTNNQMKILYTIYTLSHFAEVEYVFFALKVYLRSSMSCNDSL